MKLKMVHRFSQDEKNMMDRAYILAGRRKPTRAVMQDIANQLGYPIDKINEYFKYLIKKSKKAKVAGDSFRHHHLSSSYSNGLGPESSQHQPEAISPSPSLSPSPTLGFKESPSPSVPSQHEVELDQTPQTSGPTSQDLPIGYELYEDILLHAMMDQLICFPENTPETTTTFQTAFDLIQRHTFHFWHSL
ncbi:hypothetical protein B0J17DRAFT_772999 [Rhizoctonia solani]|nr:hypothetical protein B0J17DRAFT_772999 [Rhizoctonia solani]